MEIKTEEAKRLIQEIKLEAMKKSNLCRVEDPDCEACE